MNGIELFECMQNASTVNEILQSVKGGVATQSLKGGLYEKIWDIIIKFGCCSIFPNDTYDHYTGNINTCNITKVDNLELYLQKMKTTPEKSGASDITLRNKNTGKWVFTSSKLCLYDSKKNVKDYDVRDITSNIHYNSHKYKEYEIYLFMNDKQKVLKIIDDSERTTNDITDNIHGVLGLGDLEIYFQILKTKIQDITIHDVNTKFCNAKVPLVDRFHQAMTAYLQMIEIEKAKAKQENSRTVLLVGAKSRSGKTYGVGGLFIKYKKKYHSLNALVLTPSPKETMSQFTDDVFHKFQDFVGINIVEIKKGSDFEHLVLQENNIIIVSKQLLDDYVADKTVIAIQQLSLDLIVFDESHFHGTTAMSKLLVETYSSPKTVVLLLSATYAKPLHEYSIPSDCQFYWDMQDEKMCKERDIQGLVKKHGEVVNRFVTEENKESVLGVYDNMPNLHMLTNMWDCRYDDIKIQIKDSSYGFSMSTLFCGKYSTEVDMMLRHISGSNKEQDYPKGDKSFFGRIRKLAEENNSRTLLNNGNFTTQLWFLPFGIGMTIDKVSEHCKERMLHNRILKKYEIKIVNSKKEYNQKDIKEKIKNWELKAKEEGKDGLILLAGNQLTLGITLPMVDVVFLMNDIVSSDKIMQMMYRCMTESIHTEENDKINNKDKKMGFVVDLNPARVLNTVLDFHVHNQDMTIEQKISYTVNYELMYIDSDYCKTKENKTKLVENLISIWKTNPVNHLNLLLKKLEDMHIELDTEDQQRINRYFTSSLDDKKENTQVKFDEENEEALATGKEVIVTKLENTIASSKETEKEHIVNISITKDVLRYVLPFICYLTMKFKHVTDILEMLNIVKNNSTLLEVFEEQSFIWWNQRNVIKLIETILIKYIRKNTCVYYMATQIKEDLQPLIDQPKELLEFIDSCLKPKQKEKKENGEVFTPMKLVNEMLDKLDQQYTVEHKRSIFTESGFKWLDPASGMGNFPVAIYLKLMEGLKPELPIEEDRKKHILENMLYMSELNKKNVFVCQQIFNMKGQFKLNLYEGDTLEMDTVKEWIVEKFDVVLGNPPYQQKVGPKKTETLWDKFVMKSLKLLNPSGYLVYVHPSGWRNIDGKFKKIQKDILTRNLQYLEIHNENDGLKTFSSETRYDWYVLKNEIVDLTNTTIKFQDGTTITINVNGLEFIPNGEYEKIMSMIAKNGEESVNVIHDYSLYETRKSWMSRTKTEECKYPCIYTVNSKNEPTYFYSSKQHGHFGISKFIWSNGRISSIGSYVDTNGDYGLTQFAYAIVDKPENLQKIKEVFDSKNFRNLMELCAVGQLTVNHKVISTFKKDFWKTVEKEKPKKIKLRIVDKL